MWKKTLIVMALIPLVIACSKNVFTGRKSLNLIPNAQLNQTSFAEYRQFLSENKPMTSGKDVDLVRRIRNDTKAATDVY